MRSSRKEALPALPPRLERRRSGGTATLRHICTVIVPLRDTRASESVLASGRLSLFRRARLTSEQHWPDKDGWVKLIQQATHFTIAQEAFDKVIVLARPPTYNSPVRSHAAAMMASSRRLNLNWHHFLWPFPIPPFLGSSLSVGSGGGVKRRCVPKRWPGRWRTIRITIKAPQLGEWLMKDDKTSEKICWLSTHSATAKPHPLAGCRAAAAGAQTARQYTAFALL